jgi:hypothetical protein
MKTIKALLFLLVLTLTTHADMIVYSGAGSIQKADAATVATYPRTIVLVVDQANLNCVLIIVTPHLRTFTTLGAFSLGYAEVATRPARTIYLSTGSGANNGPNNFRDFLMRFKGPKGTFFLRAGNTSPVTLTKTLSGLYSDTGSNGAAFAVTGTMTLRFDSRRTFDNNAANRDLTNTVNDILSKFTGYSNAPL